MPYYDQILKKYKDLSKQEKIVKFFELVKNISYSDVSPRSVEESWKQQKGPCSTKNIILYDLYKAIGVPVQKWMCSFEFKKSEKFTKEMNSFLDNPIKILHTFIKIRVNKKWIVLDATHDSELEKFGFRVQKDWKGKTDTVLAVKPLEFFQVEDLDKKKHDFYSKETPEEREKRKKFMDLFFEWVDGLRKKS